MSYTPAKDGQSITCDQCGATSHNPNDIREKYCGNCHNFHRETPEDDDCLLTVIRQWPFNGQADTHPDHESYQGFLRLLARGLLTLRISGDEMSVHCRVDAHSPTE